MHGIVTPHTWYDGMEMRLAQRLGIPFIRIRQPEELTADALRSKSITQLFFPHWSHKVPKEIYDSFECIMFHMTDLPYGRGGSPLQNLIVRGHIETKLSAFQCNEGMDEGPVYLKKTLKLDGRAIDIFRRMAALAETMIAEIVTCNIQPAQQSGEVTNFKRRKPQDGDLEPLETLTQVYDHIRMLDAPGYPPAYIDVGNFIFQFSNASHSDDGLTAKVKITRKA